MADPVVTPPAVPPVNPPATAPAFFVKPDGSYIENFWEHPTFPEPLRSNLQIRTHKTLGDTLNNWASLHARDGLEVLRLPGKSADAKEWEPLWRRLGKPESKDKYELPALAEAGLGEDAKAPEPVLNAFLQAAFDADITSPQLRRFLGGWNKSIAEMSKTQKTEAETARAQLLSPLKTKWGAQFEPNVTAAQGFARSRLSPEAFERLSKAGLLDEPEVLDLFYSMGQAEREGEPDLSTPPAANAVAEAEQQVRAMQADVKGPLYTEDHPEHKAAREKYDKLVALLERARAVKNR